MVLDVRTGYLWSGGRVTGGRGCRRGGRTRLVLPVSRRIWEAEEVEKERNSKRDYFSVGTNLP